MESCDLEQFSSSSAEDQEDTIAAQEKVEGDVNHAEELDDLAREGRVLLFFFTDYKTAVSVDFDP